MSSFFLSYKNLILHTSLTLSLTLILTFLKLPILFLQGIHTYIHPDHLNTNTNTNTTTQHGGIRAAIRRPDSSESSNPNSELKRRNKSKEKFEFDENKAQIFRLKLNDSHLQTRLYFTDYRDALIYTAVATSCLVLHSFLYVSEDSELLVNGSFVPVLLGFLGLFKVVVSLARVSFERSASKRSEKELSVLVGFLGFLLGLTIVFAIVPSILDFEFDSIDGFGRFFVAVLMGFIAGFLLMPAIKSARAFWLGTDQLRWNLSIISCGLIARVLLYVNYLLTIFTSLLWINPLTEILVNNKSTSDGEEARMVSTTGNAEKLVGNVGMARSDFVKLRLWCLLVLGLLQIVTLRPNLQMYLNEAVLSWYQRLHASKVPDLDFSRAKVFLHNHYLCLVVLQFFAPPALVLLFLGLSQIDGNLFENWSLVCSLLPCSAFVKEVALFMAWWVVFVWAIFTSASLVLYRRGNLYVL